MKRLIYYSSFVLHAPMVLGPAFYYVLAALAVLFSAGVLVGIYI